MKKIITTEEYDDDGILKKKTIEEFMDVDDEKQIEYIEYVPYIPYVPIRYYPPIEYIPNPSPWWGTTITCATDTIKL